MSRHREFHARALAEARRYGQDSLVFLRELAQNARDAGASRIEVTTGADRDYEWVIFDDDGKGMTFEHARAYLFRLYASSKEGDPEAAGCFGVGFWAVLRWEPATVTVESATRQGTWALTLEAGLDDVREATCVKHGRGTRVTMTRRRRAETSGAHSATIADGLRRYCRYLRRTGAGFVPLPIRCDGVEINEPFAVPGPVCLAFASHDAEGVVGLGDEPRVELYSRGLLVMTVAVLDELEPGKAVPAKSRHVGGLAPVVLINSNRLELVLSRQAPLSSRVLRRLVRLARSRVRRLVNHVVDGACPQPWWERTRDRVRTVWNGTGLKHTLRAAALVGALAAGVGLVTFGVHDVLRRGRKHAQPRRVVVEVEPTVEESDVAENDIQVAEPTRPGRRITVEVERTAGGGPAPVVVRANLPYSSLEGYEGPTVEVPDESVMPWGLTYDPPGDVFFRAHTIDRYDARRGWLRGDADASAPYPEYRCRRDCIRVRLLVSGSSEPLIIPLPTGHRLVRTSLRFGTTPMAAVATNRYGEALVSLAPGASGVLEYVTGPYTRDKRPAIDAPDVELPPWLEKKLARIARQPPRRRVQRITKLVRERIAYDVSPATARAFSASGADWLGRVLSLSAGDCDVKNGLNVLLLRRVGIPARMAVGIAGSGGRARPQLHAWTEYFIKGWAPIDATGTARRAAPAVATAASADLPRHAATVDPPASAARAPAAPTVLGTIHRPAPLDRRWVWGLGSIALVLLVAGVLVRRRVSERVSARGDTVVQQRALARMLRDALSHPESWRAVASLWHRRVLPTLAGAPLSMAEAIRRAADGRLFVSWQRTELARLAARHGTAVLDGGDRVFAEVIGTLGAGVSLDAYDRLRPVDPLAQDALASRLDAALAPVNALLDRIGDRVECRVCPELADGALRDVDLAGVRLPRGAPWPRRFVAVNPASEEVRRRLQLMAARPAHGTFLWLDWLLDHSELLAANAARLRERAALDALEELA